MLILMLDRDDLSDRIIQLVGPRHISLTTRTMQEIAQRISQFLAIFAFYNAFIGVVLGLGLWAIGVPYAVLWGFLAAVMRFVPYVGPVAAFTLPAVFSVAHFPTWQEPILVVVLFAVVEGISNGILETIVFGRTTGISAMGLLVAAMFWTWLWGAVGLMLSTPMTLCLAVLGKYVPSLRFFAALLGEEADLAPDVRFYQRLVTLDREGAIAVADAAMKQQPRAEFFDRVLVPALSRAERDAERDELGDAEQAFIWRVVDEVLDELEKTPEPILVSASSSAVGSTTGDGAVKPCERNRCRSWESRCRTPPMRSCCGCSGSCWPRRAARWRSSETPSRRSRSPTRWPGSRRSSSSCRTSPPQGSSSPATW